MGGLSYDQHKYISIHALREEGDRADVLRKTGIINFYPRPPRGGRPDRKSHAVASDCISIHALREEGDAENAEKARRSLAFLSTPSARRATVTIVMELTDEPHFYPRPPRGGRPTSNSRTRTCTRFLSTPSARRATLHPTAGREHVRDFYPRPPRGGRLALLAFSFRAFCISIHALREEGDRLCRVLPRMQKHFYPRPPRGGRPNMLGQFAGAARFLSTPSARRATDGNQQTLSTCIISIHALREEGDSNSVT